MSCYDTDPLGNSDNKYRWDGSSLERLKTPGIADSWDSTWRSSFSSISCANIPVGNDVRYNYDTLSNGDSVQCVTDDPKGEDNRNVYRWDGSSLELFPNPAIASSWDPNWRTNKKNLDSCLGIPVGNDLNLNHPSGTIIACTEDPLGNSDNKYRWDGSSLELLRTPGIASSWNPNWRTEFKTIDCNGLKVGQDVRYKYETLSSGDLVQCVTDDPKGEDNRNVYRWDGSSLELFKSPGVADSWDPNWRTNKKNFDSCFGIPVGQDIRYKYENFASGDLVQCRADDPKGDTNNVYRWDGQRLELFPNPGIATSWDPNWRTNKKNLDNCIGIPVGNDLGVKSVSDFTGSCDDLSGTYEDVSASSLQQCGDKCRNDESSFPCGGFMWNGNTCRLFDNALITGVNICNYGWTAHRFNGIPQS